MFDELMTMLKSFEEGFAEPKGEIKNLGEPDAVIKEPGPNMKKEDAEPYMPLLEGCCYMPPLKSCGEDLARICMEAETLELEDCDYYIGTLCHLMMHCLCICLDACDCFDESTMLRETCVSLLQNLEAVVGHAGAPDVDELLACTIKLAKCCAKLETCGLGTDDCFDLCFECLKCCCECLKCLKCDTAVAKLERCIKALSLT